MQELRPGARRVVITWVALAVPTLLAFAAVFLLAMPHVLPVVWDALLGHLAALDAAVRAGNATATTVGVVEVGLLILPWLGLVLVWGMLWGALRSAAARRWGWAWLQPAVWVQVRRVAVLLVAAAVAVLVVWRTWFVALTAPAGEAETRIVNSAWTVLERGRGAAPAVPFPEAVVREQLLTYAQLTGAFERHADVVSAGRELAVASVVVLVGCLVATAVMLRWRTWVVIVPLAAVAAMGPAVGTLAAVGPGLVGAAWTAVGGTLVLAARHRHGRHRRSAGVVLHRLAVGLGIAAVAVGLATAPVLAVPLAVAAVLLVARPGAWALRPRVWTALVLSGSCLIAMAGAMSTVLFRVPAAAPLSAGEVQVLLVLAGLVVVAGALSRGSGVLAATTGALVVVALVPSPGSDAVLPLLVCATAALGALVLARWVQDRAEQGPSRQIRAALAVPVVLVVVVAALFVPERALDRPDRALPQQVGGAGTGAGVPADLGSRNGPGPVAGSEVRAVVAQMAGAASTVDSSGTAGPRGEVRWAVVDGSPSSGAPSAGVSPDGTGPGVVPPADVAPSAGGFTGAPAGAAASGRTAPGPPALGGPASGGPARSCPVPDPPATDAAASGGEAPAGGVASGGRASAGGASSGPAPGHDGAPGEAGARGRTLPDVTTGGTITDLDPGRMTSHQGLGVKVPSVVDPE
jgi:putative peptide zinc metalloprotease protein